MNRTKKSKKLKFINLFGCDLNTLIALLILPNSLIYFTKEEKYRNLVNIAEKRIFNNRRIKSIQIEHRQ